MNESKRIENCRGERGVTMVSVMLLTVSLMTLGLLAVRTSVHEVSAAGQLVARERALMVAQAAVDLATAHYLTMNEPEVNAALTGFNGGAVVGPCNDPCSDCIPGANGIVTGQRNEILSGTQVACGGRPCMRQGAVAFLPDTTAVATDWCDLPFAGLVTGGDAEARVSVWVRNNTADALGAGGSADWSVDTDGRLVITATAAVRNTEVTVEQEVMLSAQQGAVAVQPQTADEGYGGGHNNDNSAVSVCVDDYAQAQAP